MEIDYYYNLTTYHSPPEEIEYNNRREQEEGIVSCFEVPIDCCCSHEEQPRFILFTGMTLSPCVTLGMIERGNCSDGDPDPLGAAQSGGVITTWSVSAMTIIQLPI